MSRLTPSDKARIMANDVESANRFVWVGDRMLPILHLSIVDLERFKAAVLPLERLVEEGLDRGFSNILQNHKDIDGLKRSVLLSASIALRMSVDEIRLCGEHPLSLIGIVLQQWAHNFEIEEIRKRFPAPPPDKDDKEAREPHPADPTEDNPLSVVERFSSSFHWSYNDILKLTMPQVMLISSSSSWSWYQSRQRVDKESDGSNAVSSKPVELPKMVDGKKFDKLKDMTADQYRRYYERMSEVF